MNNFKVTYKIIKTFEKALDLEAFNANLIAPEVFEILRMCNLMEYSYYRLKDTENKDAIIRTAGLAQKKWAPGEGWVDFHYMTRYFIDESDYYDLYEELTEAEALAVIEGKAG
jgi:hypothetical protein